MTGTEPSAPLRGRKAECAELDALLSDVREGRSRALCLVGDVGIGKSALLDYVCSAAHGFTVARWSGVESEMELPFAALRQLCEDFLDRLDSLPEPQQDALSIALGLRAGTTPDAFLIGLGALNLVASGAESGPVLLVMDDAHWIDRASARVLAFAARRLLAEHVGIVVSMRSDQAPNELVELTQLQIRGLAEADARDMLASILRGPVDERIVDRIIAEAAGNPLALLELPPSWTPADGGALRAQSLPIANRLEQQFTKQLTDLDADTRMFMVLAAAEPLGDAAMLWRALEQVGLQRTVVTAAEATDLVEVGAHVRFRHPLIRAAAYRSATAEERRAAHSALAGVTDQAGDPDRWAWHRAQATYGPDEEVAAELMGAADRARMRGGSVAAAAFLERAATLTPDPELRAQRAVAAAWSARDAGRADTAHAMISVAVAGPPDDVRTAQLDRLRGQLAFDEGHGHEAARLLLDAAERLDSLDAAVARETHLEALTAAMWASDSATDEGLVRAARSALAGPAATQPATYTDVLLDGVATRFTEGCAAAAPALTHALELARAVEIGPSDVGRLLWLAGNRMAGAIATEVWDFDAGLELARQQVAMSRATGSLVQLQFALNFQANFEMLAGRFALADELIEEDALVAEAIGTRPVGQSRLFASAARGDETVAHQVEVLGAVQGERQGRMAAFAMHASAVWHNGLGRHETALTAALDLFDRDVLGYSTLVVAELAEAALHTNDLETLRRVGAWMNDRAKVVPTEWCLGVHARVQAMLSEGDRADELYREAIAHLTNAGLGQHVARTLLNYGEWLRRAGRRVDARTELQAAHEMFVEFGMNGFAERARRELSATGATARKRSVETVNELTSQEAQIAKLAREGFSNPEIGARLFLSPRTVEWHMSSIFSKLGIKSRRQLRDVEPARFGASAAVDA